MFSLMKERHVIAISVLARADYQTLTSGELLDQENNLTRLNLRNEIGTNPNPAPIKASLDFKFLSKNIAPTRRLV